MAFVHVPVFVVDHVSVPWCVNDVQPKAHAIFSYNYRVNPVLSDQVTSSLDKTRTMRHSLNFRRLSNWLVRLKTSLRINQVRRENGVDESRLSKTSLPCSPLNRRHVLIEQASRQEDNFREKTRYIPTTITLNWKPRFKSLCSICCVIVSKPTYDVARISPLSVEAMSSGCRRTWR